jgi:hypothetical protein
VMKWAERLDAIPEFCVGHKVLFPQAPECVVEILPSTVPRY